jgi:SAM-dependent methyltransferase
MTTRLVPAWYADDLERYRALADPAERILPIAPRDERTPTTQADPWGLHQDVWAFRRLLTLRPAWVLDVGSDAWLVALLAQFIPITAMDLRPLTVQIPGLTPVKGDVTALDYADGSAPAVMCLSTIEHVGLGRYGDAIDPQGSVKACRELQRVLAPGGRLLLSVPIADKPVTLFNRDRILTRAQIRGWLDGCELVGEYGIEGANLTVWCAEFVKGG